MISSWSLSRLEVYESCPYRAYLQYVEKIPVAELQEGPDGKEHPLTRGTRIHKLAEDFVTRDDILFPEELQSFHDDFHRQRILYREHRAGCSVEQEWAITRDWQVTGWSSATAWGRMKLDWAYASGPSMDVVDYKTGKKYAPKHIQQGQLYALVAGLRNPDVQNFNVEFWYLDSGERLTQSYTKLQTLVFKDGFERRAQTMTGATEFPPRSSAYACRFCPYGEGKDGNKYCQYRFSWEQ